MNYKGKDAYCKKEISVYIKQEYFDRESILDKFSWNI